ncbi:MAG: hypothetical protein WAU77_06870 [Solirubrobacteraceae bacterium]
MAPLLAVAVVSLAALGYAAPALASKPTGEFANFGECPLSNPSVGQCIFAQTTSGQFSIGSTEVPITKTITLQGGLILVEEPRSETFVDAKVPSNTLSKTPQTVPGGLLKIVASKKWPEILQIIFNEFINKGITGVTATTELVGTPTLNRINLLTGSGTALGLPVRVHLENSFLGSGCYIGSSSKPVTVNLTTGTTSPPEPNLPIKGNVGEIEVKHEGELIVIKNNSLVNNSFAAPEAEGCGSQILFGLFTGLIDSAVDSELGLPSAAGHNTAILNGSLENAQAKGVKESES